VVGLVVGLRVVVVDGTTVVVGCVVVGAAVVMVLVVAVVVVVGGAVVVSCMVVGAAVLVLVVELVAGLRVVVVVLGIGVVAGIRQPWYSCMTASPLSCRSTSITSSMRPPTLLSLKRVGVVHSPVAFISFDPISSASK